MKTNVFSTTNPSNYKSHHECAGAMTTAIGQFRGQQSSPLGQSTPNWPTDGQWSSMILDVTLGTAGYCRTKQTSEKNLIDVSIQGTFNPLARYWSFSIISDWIMMNVLWLTTGQWGRWNNGFLDCYGFHGENTTSIKRRKKNWKKPIKSYRSRHRFQAGWRRENTFSKTLTWGQRLNRWLRLS